MKLSRLFTPPAYLPEVNRRNFRNVQIDAIGVGLTGAAAPFLPVFLARLGASNFQVGMLTAMPAITGFLLAIPLGQFLQTRTKIVPWFSMTRLGVISCYAITGVIALILPQEYLVNATLLIWALATLPQTVLAITFSVVMNAVAGPRGRYELMTRRWSTLGATTTIAVLLAGQVLDRIEFPYNYPLVFIGLSVGGLISYYFSSQINIPDSMPQQNEPSRSLVAQARSYFRPILSERAFISFTLKRFVFLSGTSLATPLLPLYFVRELNASDSWIAAINTTQTAILIIGYFFWSQQSRSKGSRTVLLWTTCGLALYPALVAMTQEVWLIALYAGLAGVFQAGVDLVFFDELMKTVPPEYSATFVSFAQSMQYLSAIIAPLLGTTLADQIGLPAGLLIAAAIRLLGFILFLRGKPAANKTLTAETQDGQPNA